MTPASHPSASDMPAASLVAVADLMGEMASVSQAAALAALKVEMEGLAVLFGGTSGPKSEAALQAEEAETEAAFDNLPV